MKSPNRYSPPRVGMRQPLVDHKWYALGLWKGRNGLRRKQLEREPLCRVCAQAGRTSIANEVDHIRPHRGNWSMFLDERNLQSLCKGCHSQKTIAGG